MRTPVGVEEVAVAVEETSTHSSTHAFHFRVLCYEYGVLLNHEYQVLTSSI